MGFRGSGIWDGESECAEVGNGGQQSAVSGQQDRYVLSKYMRLPEVLTTESERSERPNR